MTDLSLALTSAGHMQILGLFPSLIGNRITRNLQSGPEQTHSNSYDL